MPVENSSIVWKDRKRIFGLPISFTKYSATNDRLFVSKGLLSVEENELLLYRILDLKLNISLFDRMFGVGTLTLYCADETERELKIQCVKKPREVRDMLSKMIENERIRTGVRGREIFGAAEGGPHV